MTEQFFDRYTSGQKHVTLAHGVENAVPILDFESRALDDETAPFLANGVDGHRRSGRTSRDTRRSACSPRSQEQIGSHRLDNKTKQRRYSANLPCVTSRPWPAKLFLLASCTQKYSSLRADRTAQSAEHRAQMFILDMFNKCRYSHFVSNRNLSTAVITENTYCMLLMKCGDAI